MPGKGRKVSWHYCLKKTTGYAVVLKRQCLWVEKVTSFVTIM